MTEKRFTKCGTKIRDNGEEMTQAEVRDMLNNLHEIILEQDGKIIGLRSKNGALQSIAETQQQLTRLANKYNFNIEDIPDILEEYILIDNEVIEQKNIENTIKEAYNNERTQIGKNVLKQLMETIQ